MSLHIYLAEIPTSKEFLKKNDLSSLSSSLTDELFALSNILLPNLTTNDCYVLILRAGHLSSGNSHVSHCKSYQKESVKTICWDRSFDLSGPNLFPPFGKTVETTSPFRIRILFKSSQLMRLSKSLKTNK